MVSVEATEPLEAVGVGDSDNALLEAFDAHETVDEIVAAHDDEIEKSIAVGIGGMKAVAVQDNGAEASHGTTMDQLVGSNGSMDSGGIAEAEARLGAAEDVGARTVRRGKSRGRRIRHPGNQRKKE